MPSGVEDVLHINAAAKKLRFRGDAKFTNKTESTQLSENDYKSSTRTGLEQPNEDTKETSTAAHAAQTENPSFWDFFKVEMTRGYMLEHDEERYTARREKIYAFIRIPREMERFIVYGIMQCADSFLYIHTFLPIRYVMALWSLIYRPIARCLGVRRRAQRLLAPAEVCDLLKGTMWIACTLLMISIDTNRVYHEVKSQSIIKLYIFFNMLEMSDRLLSAFGQDTIDALFWTATEPKKQHTTSCNLIKHTAITFTYLLVHSTLIMLQATCLNVALNSNNKGLLTVMISNNFVELKGAVFKKFDKNNLFQLSCSDVRERFHLSVLLFIVVIQTMKEFEWSFSHFCEMLPDCFAVLITEILIDWLKHAFITRFNEIPEGIYREYTTSLAYDMTQTRQKHAFSDHSDLVARRMGFIPFPLGVVLIKAIYSAVSFDNLAAVFIFLLTFACLMGIRIWITILALGKACKLMREHQDEKSNSTPSSITNMLPISSSLNATGKDVATSPVHPHVHFTQRAFQSYEPVQLAAEAINKKEQSTKSSSNESSTETRADDVELDVTNSLELGATALFSNSDVDINDLILNENVPEAGAQANSTTVEEDFAHSEPDLLQQQREDIQAASQQVEQCVRESKRTHKRSESEPSMQSIVGTASESEELLEK